jgi:creatinine amidohydrolase
MGTRESPTSSVGMAEMDWVSYRTHVQAGGIVILPVGALEQHGHHLPLGVDALIATHVAARVARQVGGVLAPTISYGYRSQPRTGGGSQFPGTTGLDGSTLTTLIRDVVRELATDGATKLAVVDGHYENEMFLTDGIELALRELRRDGVEDAHVVKLRYFEDLSLETIELLWPDGYPGMALEHAALMETSMVMHLAPHLVRLERAPIEPAASFPPYDVYPTDITWIPSAGALSSPHRATAAFGKRLIDEFVQLVTSAIRREFP